MGYLKVLDSEKNMLDALDNNEALGATVYAFHDKATYLRPSHEQGDDQLGVP